MTVAAYPRRFATLVKFEHTIFALPFAYVGAFLAVGGIPSAHDLLWITIAMVGARSLAMALNRLIDARIDAANPRTATRKTASDASEKAHACAGERRPLGSSRPAVRGFRASISASISRLSAIASERAPTIATVIHTRSCALGTPPTARNAPT